MDDLARLTDEERNEIITEAASLLGLDPIAVEKDFWVCWALSKAFSLPEGHPNLLFKGGTSLSKAYRLINRFSEDIDITVSRSDLGFEGDRDPETISRRTSMNAGRRSRDELREACRDYVEGTLLPDLHTAFAAVLGETGEDWRVECDPEERQNLHFLYPSVKSQPEYVGRRVFFECGAFSDQEPSGPATITPYIAEVLPSVFEQPEFVVSRVLAPEHTFIEKLLILHGAYHKENPRAGRLSRHYYDVATMAQSDVKERALRDGDPFERVREHKTFYFPSAGRRYDLARPGSLRLVPNDALEALLRRDYDEMDVMFFGDIPRPSFDEIIELLTSLEHEINR